MTVNSKAIEDVLAERRRQIGAKGYSSEHDDKYQHGQLRRAALCYAGHSGSNPVPGLPPKGWPWRKEFWKPSNLRRALVKAAALLIAEIERIDRRAEKQS